MSTSVYFEEEKYHLTELEISLSKLKHNLDRFASFLKPETKIMLLIKADAYGHGAEAIADAFEKDERIGYFSTSYVDEGIRLREHGIQKSILILNPAPRAFQAMVEHCLEPEIHNLELLNDFIHFLQKHKPEGSAYPVHLKFNTGMNRLGFDPSDLQEVVGILTSQRVIKVRSMMTHLSSAHAAEEDEYTLGQLESFKKIIEESRALQSEDCFFHALNSSGIFRFPEHQYQMVRLGIGFYGTSSIPELRDQLRSATTFKSKVCQVRKVEKGASISYSRSGRAQKDEKIATLSLGYADGFNRLLSNGNWEVEIRGKLYPTIGNICMGLSMVEVGDDPIEVGDEVIIFGGKKSIYDYAQALNTITYEVMCSIGPRVKRTIVD